MIPRFAPTYTYSDLLWAFKNCNREELRTELQSRLRDYFGVKHVFLVNSGKEAIYAILKVYDRPGGVLTPAYSCIEVAKAVSQAGYFPVFIDNELDTLNINIRSIKKSLSDEITIILPVHIFGIPCNMEEIRNGSSHTSRLILEDAAPAFGAKLNGKPVGKFGDASVISFHWTKTISGEGGGAILTDNDEFAGKLDAYLLDKKISNHCTYLFFKAMLRKMVTTKWFYRFFHYVRRQITGEAMFEVVQYKEIISQKQIGKMSGFSCALILRQFDQLEWNLNRRNQIAQIYFEELSNLEYLRIPKYVKGSLPSWIQFPVLVDDKFAFYKHMQKHGIDVTWSYRYSCPDTYDMGGYANSQEIAKSILGLPTYPTLSDAEAREICLAARKYKNF